MVWEKEWTELNGKESKWKTYNACSDTCWCRCIVIESATESQIKECEDLDNPVIVIGSGHLSKLEAEYFVELHNARLENDV